MLVGIIGWCWRMGRPCFGDELFPGVVALLFGSVELLDCGSAVLGRRALRGWPGSCEVVGMLASTLASERVLGLLM